MLTDLDPHSAFLNRKHFRDMQVQTKGEFGGLGIEVTMEGGYVKVVSPIDETPAFRAGMKASDLITHLDGEHVRGLTLSQAVEKMRGPINSDITLTVRRDTKVSTSRSPVTKFAYALCGAAPKVMSVTCASQFQRANGGRSE